MCIEPALRINLSLMIRKTDKYLEWLVRQLMERSMVQVSRLPEVTSRYWIAREKQKNGLSVFRSSSRFEDDGVVYEIYRTNGVVLNRYFPYYLYPKAKYSVGAIYGKGGLKVTAMVNPWIGGKEVNGVNIGRIFSKYGGGGHKRVGSVLLHGAKRHLVGGIIGRVKAEVASKCLGSPGGR